MKNRYIHRLVAESFLPNENEYPEVDHKDGNISNNNVENLRWCTHLENVNNPNTVYKSNRRKPCAVFDLNGNKINEYTSVTEAAKATNVPVSSICCIAKGICGMNGYKHGLTFKYI